MKKFGTYILTGLLGLSLNFVSPGAFAFDQFITVKFRENVSAQFIKELNEVTNTTISKIEAGNTYVFELNGPSTTDTLDRYAELFAIMPLVENISPLPRDKADDKINPYYYLNLNVNESQAAQPDQSQGAPIEKPVPDEFIVKFNPGMPAEDINNFNQNLGVSSTYIKETDSYRIKIPADTDLGYFMDFYGQSGYVSSVEQNQVIQNAQPKNNENKSVSANKQSGVSMAIPLSGRDIKVTFRIGEEVRGMDWLAKNLKAQLVSKKGMRSYVLRFPAVLNPKMVARAVKVCNFVSMAEVSGGN